MAAWLAFPTSDHEVPSFNPAEGGIQLITDAGIHCTEPSIITLSSSQYDLNDVELDVIHKTIICG